jgi:hypothetical protein
MNPALATMSRAEQELALARRLAVRNTRLKNNKLLLSAAAHLAIRQPTSQNLWPVISANALADRSIGLALATGLWCYLVCIAFSTNSTTPGTFTRSLDRTKVSG